MPERDADRYRSQIQAPLARLRGLRALFVAVDQQQTMLPPGLTGVRTELSGILRALNGVRPSDAVRGSHDLLMRATSLALMAITLRDVPPGQPPDPEALRNASSAAAGALLLLDRVCIEIGCTAPAA